jgi:hypothetical protein
MNRLRRHRGSSPVLWLALAALSLRALIPDGYMLAPRAELAAGVPVALCPAQNPELAPLLQRGHAHHHHHPAADGGGAAHGGDSCPFALAAGPALLPAAMLAGALPALPQILVAMGPVRSILSGYRRAATARGPPAFS